MLESYDTEDTALDQDSTEILPNSVQLIETKMLPSRSSNWDQLSGTYLFCQIYQPNDYIQSCVMCSMNYDSIAELKIHYQTSHDLIVVTKKAEYDKSFVFECSNEQVNFQSAYCKANFGTLEQLADHYMRWHEDTDTNLLVFGEYLLKRLLYCGLCSEFTNSFLKSIRHMKDSHGMKTFSCRYCSYCNPVPSFLRTHEVQEHEQYYSQAVSQCSVCSRYTLLAKELTKHVLKCHVVQIAANYWSCASCLRTYADPSELMEHLKTCSKLLPASTSIQTSKRKDHSVFTCNYCPLSFVSEEELKKHENEGYHIVGIPGQMIQSSMNMKDTRICDPSIFGVNTCFLCCMRFATSEMFWNHHHHVHTQWMNKKEACSGQTNENAEETESLQEQETSHIIENEHVPENENNLEPVIDYVIENEIPFFTDFVEQQLTQLSKQTIAIEANHCQQESTIHERVSASPNKPLKSLEVMDIEMAEVNSNEEMSKQTIATEANHCQQGATIHERVSASPDKPLKPLEVMDIEMAQVDSNEENLHKEAVQSEDICKAEVCSKITRLATEVENEFAELGLPPKFGHYCDLCDQVIQNYCFYYLHMRRFHGLVKRFKCVVSACGKVFSGNLEFQDHAFWVHNQKSQHNCEHCGLVLGSEDELQAHLNSSSHKDKMKFLTQNFIEDFPQNHKCSICQSWFGLFSIFVNHMENGKHDETDGKRSSYADRRKPPWQRDYS